MVNSDIVSSVALSRTDALQNLPIDTISWNHRQIHKTLDHLPSLVVEAGLEQVRPFCCWYWH